MSKRVLVAGGTGYLGGYVLEEFKKRGHFVRALARSPGKLDAKKQFVDEVAKGEVTEPASLKGCCDGIDIVFSSVGITKQKGKLTFKDVDFQGNLNLLEEAKRAGVKQFIYVSVYNARNLMHLEIVKAHEDFVDVLRESGMDYRVIRPTGYFSDMGEILDMAKKGRVFVFGDGTNRINPIHGADLAKFCVDSSEGTTKELDVGGPEVLSLKDIGTLALKTLDKPVKISSMPMWLTNFMVWLARLFNHHNGEVLAFVTTMASTDVVCSTAVGEHYLRDHYARLAGKQLPGGAA